MIGLGLLLNHLSIIYDCDEEEKMTEKKNKQMKTVLYYITGVAEVFSHWAQAGESNQPQSHHGFIRSGGSIQSLGSGRRVQPTSVPPWIHQGRRKYLVIGIRQESPTNLSPTMDSSGAAEVFSHWGQAGESNQPQPHHGWIHQGLWKHLVVGQVGASIPTSVPPWIHQGRWKHLVVGVRQESPCQPQPHHGYIRGGGSIQQLVRQESIPTSAPPWLELRLHF